MNIVYNCGYRPILEVEGASGKKYRFRMRHVTAVTDEDAPGILAKTSDNVPWCSRHPANIPPFMELEAWCRAKNGRFEYGSKNPQKFNPQEYLRLFSVQR